MKFFYLLTAFALPCLMTISVFAYATASFTSNETEIELSAVPANVKAAFVDALARQKGIEIEAITDRENGKLVYEIEFELGDFEIEVEIGADGKVVEVEVGDEDDKDEKN